MDCAAALATVRHAPTLLEGMRRVDALVEAAGRTRPDTARGLLLTAINDSADDLTAIAAVHALGAVAAPWVDDQLLTLVRSGGFLGEHAVWAFGSRRRHDEAVATLVALATAGGFSGMLAEHTLESWRLGPHGEPLPHKPAEDRDESPSRRTWCDDGRGLTVAQLFLHADIDGQLTHSGQGDTGGIATLLVRLGDALIATRRVDRVITLSRGGRTVEELTDGLGGLDGTDDASAPGHHYIQVPLPGPRVHATDAWRLRVAAECGIRRILDALGPVDVLHLRMADVGSMAAARVAEALDIPFVLTLAPDPHALVAAREQAGELCRSSFGEADAREHLFFRERLLRALADGADHLVLFPRADIVRDAKELLGLELPDLPATGAEGGAGTGFANGSAGARPGGTPRAAVRADAPRVSIIEEGIDTATVERVRQEVHGERPRSPTTRAALRELDDLLEALPPSRRDLPVAISLGRLHPVKGMATLVQAWAEDAELSEACNLLVVGGDLDDPNDDELGQLELIDQVIPRHHGPGRGLLLTGHRPNATATVWLAAAAVGRPGLAPPRGIYVSASHKEEFGIAILEALAAGLVVVAPRSGGPATYVDEGVTGVLCDTRSPTALASAVRQALDLAAASGAGERSAAGRAMVRARFSIERVASVLAEVYEQVATRRHTPSPPAEEEVDAP